MKIIKAQIKHMPVVRELFREYQGWLNEACCFKGFEQELASLPGRYAAPKGVIFLAFDNTNAIACAAIRPRIDKADSEAELKRLFVNESYRGRGLGKVLFNKVMLSAKHMAYSSIVLETLPDMQIAKSLYLDYGFKPIPAYFDNADAVVEFYRYTFEQNEQKIF